MRVGAGKYKLGSGTGKHKYPGCKFKVHISLFDLDSIHEKNTGVN